jgi:protease I
MERTDATGLDSALPCRKQIAMKKVLIIVGDATETLDTMYPFYRLIEAGMQPVVAGPERKSTKWFCMK